MYSQQDDDPDYVEDVECPDFDFPTTACYICNGYYGPCFDEHVCATCHTFLFPNDLGVLQIPFSSEKTDDEDSGNDEPTDLCYNNNSERRTNNQQQNLSQILNDSNNSNIKCVTRSPLQQLSPSLQTEKFLIQRNNNSIEQEVNNGFPIRNSRVHNQQQQHPGPSSSSNKSMQITSKQEFKSYPQQNLAEIPQRSSEYNHFSKIQDYQNGSSGSTHYSYNSRPSTVIRNSSRALNLSERLEMLSNHKHVEHEPIDESELVERLPPEVLLTVFSYLDDLSIWSVMKVCRRWYGLLSTHVTSHQWQKHVELRWPLYKPVSNVSDWYKIYEKLASSTPCRICLTQTYLQTKLPRVEESSWRRNRLHSELKSLRIDPPEGIDAAPLDQMCCQWQATITGPAGSPYEGGLFFLYLQVPLNYPLRPPIVRFLTRILHPNVSRHGDVGIDSIHHNWSLALTISKVLISVQSLLTDPYCQVCMEPELGQMYMNDRERFEEIARLWTWKYAMHDVLAPF